MTVAIKRCLIFSFVILFPTAGAAADIDISLLYAGAYRLEQSQIDNGQLSRDELRLAGLRMFTMPFTRQHGYGDGEDPLPTSDLGSRGTLQNNGTFLRFNGLDAQTCLECHSVVSRRTTPMQFGIGGFGGISTTALPGATYIDLLLTGPSNGDPSRNINGRVINPPFLFGAGAVELLAREMTRDLNTILAGLQGQANATAALTSKGTDFGSLSTDASGNIAVDADGNAIGVEGLFDRRPAVNGEANSNFLVVAPFGRKGDFKTTRDFDVGALGFHLGMEVGNHDNDNDGVFNEVTTGELSALSIFAATMQRPRTTRRDKTARQGRKLFRTVGCTECHRPAMHTNSTELTFSNPEIGNDPDANIYYRIDLTDAPMRFRRNKQGGISVPLYADLKRHHMGPSLAEFDGDDLFTTARLWGVADTAPYLHDGRALTLREAIELHGTDVESEAHTAVQDFIGLAADDQQAILVFLNTLRTPNGRFPDLDKLARKIARRQGIRVEHR